MRYRREGQASDRVSSGAVGVPRRAAVRRRRPERWQTFTPGRDRLRAFADDLERELAHFPPSPA